MIVLVGNAQESEHRLKDYSAFIDSDKPRLVVRVSKMCNYDSGKTGTRCDWVFLNPNPMYWTFPPERRVRWCPWHNGIGEFALYANLSRNGRIFRLDGGELCFNED